MERHTDTVVMDSKEPNTTGCTVREIHALPSTIQPKVGRKLRTATYNYRRTCRKNIRKTERASDSKEERRYEKKLQKSTEIGMEAMSESPYGTTHEDQVGESRTEEIFC